jgi:alpha-L-fucosidase
VDIGNWLQVNGEAIYGSRKYLVNSIKEGDQEIYFTTKDGQLFCILTKWDTQIEINLAGGQQINEISLLGSDERIIWETDGDKLVIELPGLTVDEVPCLDAWTIKVELEE